MRSTVPPPVSVYHELKSRLREAATLGSIGSLVAWDQETYMPPAAASFRAEQIAVLRGIVHQRFTDPRIGELLSACESDRALTGDPTTADAANIREIRRKYDRATRLPLDLVRELARVGSQAQEAWKHAREANDFPAFAPWLEKVMALTRRKAECYQAGQQLAPGTELYDALLDEHEPGATARQIAGVFAPLAPRLSTLVRQIGAAKRSPGDAPLRVSIDPDRQHVLGQRVVGALGFDFSAGRLDTTTHPFCSGIAPGDTRLTTRYRESSWTDALFGSLHEAGHGLYEQGLPKAGHLGEPLCQSISLGIHESQSRMWENFVGRSREFWSWLTPIVRETAEGGLDGYSADDLYAAANIVRPSFIRVEADEATYNLHVMIRFEIERAFFVGDLSVADIPGEWNRKYKQYLGVDVPDNKRGCLQDVHWSFGLIGYFPTYTLGNLYAAQFYETIRADIPNLDARIAVGDFSPLKTWLNTNIHAHGMRYRAAELCEKLTGKPLGPDPLMRHLEGKLLPLYK